MRCEAARAGDVDHGVRVAGDADVAAVAGDFEVGADLVRDRQRDRGLDVIGHEASEDLLEEGFLPHEMEYLGLRRQYVLDLDLHRETRVTKARTLAGVRGMSRGSGAAEPLPPPSPAAAAL